MLCLPDRSNSRHQQGKRLTRKPSDPLVRNDRLTGIDPHNARITALAEEAVESFSDPTAPDWAFGDQAGAQCNLALIRLQNGEIDGAAEAIRPVLDLAPAQRNRGIVVSAARVGSALLGPARDTVSAQELRAEIEAYSPSRLALPS